MLRAYAALVPHAYPVWLCDHATFTFAMVGVGIEELQGEGHATNFTDR